jgi:hypothetical protein
MKKVFIFCLAFLAMAVFASCSAWSISGEAMGNPFLPGEKITNFVAGYYKISESDVIKTADKCEYPDDTIATLSIAKLGGKNAVEISGMRAKGMTWNQILQKTGVQPSKLFIPVKSKKIPKLFDSAYKQYDKWQKDKSYRINLSDRDVRYLSGMKFVVEAFKKDAFETMESFDNRITFVKIIYDYVESGKY